MCSNCSSTRTPRELELELEELELEELEEEVKNMLIHANMWVGGHAGVGSKEGMALLKQRGLVGPKCGLTRLGVQEAKIAARKYFDGE